MLPLPQTSIPRQPASISSNLPPTEEKGFELDLSQQPGDVMTILEGTVKVECHYTTRPSKSLALTADKFARFVCQHRHELSKDPYLIVDQIKMRWPQISNVIIGIFLNYQCDHFNLDQTYFDPKHGPKPDEIDACFDMGYAYQMKGDQAGAQSKKEEQLFYYFKALFCGSVWNLFHPGTQQGELLLARIYFALICSPSDRSHVYPKALLHACNAAELSSSKLWLPIKIARSFNLAFVQAADIRGALESSLHMLTLPSQNPLDVREILENILAYATILDHNADAIGKILAVLSNLVPTDQQYRMYFSSIMHEYYCLTGDLSKAHENLNALPPGDIRNLYEIDILIKEKKLSEAHKKLSSQAKSLGTKAPRQILALTAQIFELQNAKPLALMNYEQAIAYSFKKEGPANYPRNSWLLAKCRLLAALGPAAMLSYNMALTLSILEKNGASDHEDYQKAYAAFALTSTQAAIRYEQNKLEKHPEDEENAYKLIQHLISTSRMGEARSVGIHLFIRRLKKPSESNLQRDVRLTEALISLDLLDQAKRCFDLFLRDKKNEEVLSLELHILELNKQHELAIEKGKEYLKMYPKSSRIHGLIAGNYFYLKRYAEALPYATASVDYGMRGSTEKDRAGALHVRMQIHIKLKAAKAALRDHDTLKTYKPDLDKETIEELYRFYVEGKRFKEAKVLIDVHQKTLGKLYDELKNQLPQKEPRQEVAEESPLPPPTAAPAPIPPAQSTSRKLPEAEPTQSKKHVPKNTPPVSKFSGTKKMQEEEAKRQLLDPFYRYRSTHPLFIEQLKLKVKTNRCSSLDGPVDEPDPEPAPEPEPVDEEVAAPPQIVLKPGDLKRTEKEIEELRAREEQAKRLASFKPVREVFPYLSPIRLSRLKYAQHALICFGDFPKRLVDFSPEFQKYLSWRVPAYGFIKLREAFHSTSNRVELDRKFLQMITPHFMHPALALALGNAARHEFECISPEKLSRCAEILYHPDLLQNLANCITYHSSKDPTEHKDLKLAPAPSFPPDLSILDKSRISTRDQVIEELNWLIKMSKDEKVMGILRSKKMAPTSDYTFAARMSISMIVQGFIKLGTASRSYQWLAHYSQAIGHEVESIDDVPIPEILLVMSQAPSILKDFLQSCPQY